MGGEERRGVERERERERERQRACGVGPCPEYVLRVTKLLA